MHIKKITLPFILLILFSICIYGQDGISITNQMFATVKSVKTLQYTFDSKERLSNGKIHIEKSTFKINTSPLKIYLYQHAPKKGLQG